MMPSWERHFLWPLQWMGHGYNMLKTHLGVQDHQSTTFGSSVAQQYFMGKAITPSSRVSLGFMSTWWKASLISFQKHLVWPQDHVGKASKPSWQVAIVSTKSCVVVMGMIFTLVTLAQVVARSKEMDNTSRKPLDFLLLGHHFRRLARTSKLSWRPNLNQIQVHLGL